MSRWTGPGRFTAQGEGALSRGRLADLQGRARKVVGDLENQVRLGGIWYGFHRIKLEKGVEVVATVDANDSEVPFVQARLLIDSQLVEERDREAAGIVWQFANDTDLFLAARGDQFSVFSNSGAIEELVDTSRAIPKYTPQLFQSKIKAGKVDWQFANGEVISWDGPSQRSIIPIGSGLSTFGPNIYQNGEIIYSFTALEKVIGAARTEDNRLVAIVVTSQGHFTAYTIESGVATTQGFINGVFNSDAFSPRSPAFFNLAGTKAVAVLDNMDVIDDRRDEVWVELKFSLGAGFSTGGFYRPKVYEYEGQVITLSTSEATTTLTSRTSSSIQVVTDTNIRFSDVSEEYGRTWATPNAKRLVCADYASSGVQRRVEIERKPPRVEQEVVSISGSTAFTDSYTSSFDELNQVYRQERNTSGSGDSKRDENISLRIATGELLVLVDGQTEAEIPNDVFAGSWSSDVSRVSSFTATFPEVEESPSAAKSLNWNVTQSGVSENIITERSILFYVDVRFNNIGLAVFTSHESPDREFTELRQGDWSVTGLQVGSSCSFIGDDDITVNTGILENNPVSKGRLARLRSLASEELGESDNSPFTFQETRFLNGLIDEPCARWREVIDVGTVTSEVESDKDVAVFTSVNPNKSPMFPSETAINNIVRDNHPNFIGSGAAQLFQEDSLVDHATAENQVFFIDLLEIGVLGNNGTTGLEELTHYNIRGRNLSSVVFPKSDFVFSLKNV